jgi:hypothetical protein
MNKELEKLEREKVKVEKELVQLASKLLREAQKPVRKTKTDYVGGPDSKVLKDLASRITDIVEFLAR